MGELERPSHDARTQYDVAKGSEPPLTGHYNLPEDFRASAGATDEDTNRYIYHAAIQKICKKDYAPMGGISGTSIQSRFGIAYTSQFFATKNASIGR